MVDGDVSHCHAKFSSSVISRENIMRVPVGLKSRGLLRCALGSLLALVIWFWLVGSIQPARAQQEPTGEVETPSTDTPTAPPNLFKHIIRSAGIVFGPLLLIISIGLVALIVLLAMDLRMDVAIPPEFVEEFTDTVNKRRFKEAFDLARADTSFLGRVLTAGMARLQYGIEDSREVVYNTVESIKASKEQLIAYLATIGTLGPMIGLVGTVFGMILSFMELGRGGSPNAAELAKGISHALVVTLLGVAISVPAIFCHAFFRNRLIRMSMDTANIADDLLTQMYHNSRKPAPPVPPVGPAPANTSP
jgi:biopolymer transport protein ExbB